MDAPGANRGLSQLPSVRPTRLWQKRSTWLVASGLVLAVLLIPRIHLPKSAKPPPPHPAAAVVNVNVSRLADTQAETTVAVDPRNPRLLIAASNDWSQDVSSWTSQDSGQTWATDDVQLMTGPRCIDGDPALAIDEHGGAYFAVLGSECVKSAPERVFVARRPVGSRQWLGVAGPVADGPAKFVDDKPALAVDLGRDSPHRNRIYAAWARSWVDLEVGAAGAIVITHSDDGARTWSPLASVSPASQLAFSANISIAPNGDVYITWDDPGNRGIWIDRSHDGVHFGTDRLVAPYLPVGDKCDVEGARIPAQPHRCVGPNPTLTLDTEAPMRVQVTYGNTDQADDSQSIFVVVFDKTLRHVIMVGRPIRGGSESHPRSHLDSKRISFGPSQRLTRQRNGCGCASTTRRVTDRGVLLRTRAWLPSLVLVTGSVLSGWRA